MRHFVAILAVFAAVNTAAITIPARAAPPAPAVIHAHATWGSSSSVRLVWTIPSSTSYRAAVVRLRAGTRPPGTAHSGDFVARVYRPRHSVVIHSLVAGTRYTVAIFATDGREHFGAGAVVAFKTGPRPVRGLRASRTDASITLTWRNPESFLGVTVSRVRGKVIPNEPWRHRVRLRSPRATSLTMHAASSTRYTFAIWTYDRHRRYSSIRRISVRTRAVPGPVSSVRATPQAPRQIALSWRNPSSRDFFGVLIRRVHGHVKSLSLRSGTRVASTSRKVSVFTDRSIPRPGTYTYALFAHDASSHYARAVLITATTTAHTATPPAIQGTVVQAVSHLPIANVVVTAQDDAAGPVLASTKTGADGYYSLKDVWASSSYILCFNASHAVGRSRTGYASACRHSRLAPSAAKVITGINAYLYRGAAFQGTITSAGHPVRNVNVLLYRAGAPGDEAAVTSVTSGDTGRFEASGLPASPNAYTLCFDTRRASGATASGYQSQCRDGSAWQVGRRVPTSATRVALSSGHVTSADESLSAGAAISGTVTDATSAGIAGAIVTVHDLADDFTTVASQRTADNGDYFISGLASSAAGYAVCFTAYTEIASCYNGVGWNRVSEPAQLSVVQVHPPQTTTGVDASLDAGGAITGAVAAAVGGKPLAGISVRVFDSADVAVATATTGANGAYEVAGLVPGSGYAVCFDARHAKGGSSTTGYLSQCWRGISWNPVSVPPGTISPIQIAAAASQTNIDATLGNAGVVAGRVRAANGGASVRGVRVTVYDGAGALAGTSTTARDGTYRIANLIAGSYLPCFLPPHSDSAGYLPQCYRGAAWNGQQSDLPRYGITRVSLGSGSAVSGVNPVLRSGGAMAGKVVAADGGAALTDVEVDLFDSLGDPVGGIALSAPDGTFLFTQLPPGKYAVCFDPSAASGGRSVRGYQGQCYRRAAWRGNGLAPPSTVTHVAVAAAHTSSAIDAALSAAGAVSGKVATTSGRVVGGESVYVYDTSGLRRTSATAANGTFTATGLPSGKYTVCFGGAVGYLPACYPNSAWIGSSAEVPPPNVTVSGGHTTVGVDVRLVPAATVSGAVTAGGTGGVPGVQVYAFDPNGVEAARTSTDTRGTYVLSGLRAGKYVVCFDTSTATGAPEGYLPQCYSKVAWNGFDIPPGVTTLSLSAGQAAKAIDASLTIAGAITGNVTSARDGSPIAGVGVKVYDENGSLAGYDYTGADGTYDVTGLVPNPSPGYAVCFDSADAAGTSPTGYASQCYKNVAWDGGSVPGDATAVPVVGGATVRIDTQLGDET